MLEFDDIQHILLTRTPAITGRYEFLSFDTRRAGGHGCPSCWTRRSPPRCGRHDGRAPIAGSRWRSRGMACARSACRRSRCTFPEEFREGMAARADILGDTGAAAPSTGSAAWPATTCTRSRSCSRAPTNSAVAPSRSTTSARPHRRVRSLVVPRPQRDTAVQLRPRPFRLPGPVVAAGDEGLGEEPTPGSGAPLEPGEFILGYPDENGPVAISPSPRCCRATAATWRTAG